MIPHDTLRNLEEEEEEEEEKTVRKLYAIHSHQASKVVFSSQSHIC